MFEHWGIFAFAGKRVKSDDDSAIKENPLFCNHAPDFEDLSILATNKNDLALLQMNVGNLFFFILSHIYF